MINVLLSTLVLHNSGGHESYFYWHFSFFFSLQPCTETFDYVYVVSAQIFLHRTLHRLFSFCLVDFSDLDCLFRSRFSACIPIQRPYKSLAFFKYFEMKANTLMDFQIERSVESSKCLKIYVFARHVHRIHLEAITHRCTTISKIFALSYRI